MNIEVIRHFDELNRRDVWTFWLSISASGIELRFNSYQAQERATSRSKFRTISGWYRLSFSGYASDIKRPTVPNSIATEAIVRICSMVRGLEVV